MVPTSVILSALQTLIADDTATLAAATALHVHLITEPFTPGPETSLADLTEATFTGSTPLAAGTGNQQAFNDPITGRLVVQLKEPAGGWHWVATAGTSLPQNVVGFVVTDTANAVTYGSALLPNAVTIGAIGDAVDIPYIRFEFQPPVLV